ncbi:MAG: zinc-dependent metalloprotease [Chloroflexi bacterium]|nr:zinc-dependent metalloprotease [Chloroflexota bacterium]
MHGTPTLIDWERVRRVATGMNRELMAAAHAPALRQRYAEQVNRCVPLIAEFTGQSLPRALDTVFVFDRNDWVTANIDNFRQLFEPVEEMNRRGGGQTAMPGGAAWSVVNQMILSTQLGVLLGYLSRRVLGQYDLALLGKEPVDAGKLYFVEPNIAAVQQQLDLPGADFRMWVALHETTHAFEFEANPWLQRRFNHLLTAYFRLLEDDLAQLRRGMDAVRTLLERARRPRVSGERWLHAIMTPEQRAIFDELQAIMCILEGYSNYVMNGIGRDLLPGYDRITARISQRQRDRGVAERMFIRLTGLDMKLEQYILGESFINTVVERRGRPFLARLWAGPETMPTLGELHAPERWIARVEANGVLPAGGPAPA